MASFDLDITDVSLLWMEKGEARRLEKQQNEARREKARRQIRKDREALEASKPMLKPKTATGYRKTLIGRLMARGLTDAEIAESLNKVNVRMRTGNKVTPAVVSRDRLEIVAKWKETCDQSAQEFREKQLKELAELKMTAWEDGNHSLVLKIIEREAALVGTNQLAISAGDGAVNVKNEYNQINLISSDERDKRIMELVDAARARGDGETIEGGTVLEATARAKAGVLLKSG